MSVSSSAALSSLLRQSCPRHSPCRVLNPPFLLRKSRQSAAFHATPGRRVIKPYLLADIGEGITECQIIQWFVQPGARVAQFDKICEVQSDKAAVEITSRFDGVIKKLHYDADDMARVGKPLVDIDIQGEISPEDEALTKTGDDATKQDKPSPAEPQQNYGQSAASTVETSSPTGRQGGGTNSSLATPAVRHLSKELDVDIGDVLGSGKDGRVLKEDVQRFATSRRDTASSSPGTSPLVLGEDKNVPLVGIRNQMFKTMTRSLSIPHFLYADNVDLKSLNAVRRRLNAFAETDSSSPKLSSLPFILKAVSLALDSFPALNAHLDTSDPTKPILTHKAAHNIGIAIDTPQGLVVPVVSAVQSHSISSLALEITRLANLARTNKLAAADLQGATFTVSNIGSIGGTVVAPVIVGPQVAILGVGRARAVPAFDADGELVRREDSVFSWSADHRVVDGAMVARAAELVRLYLEDVERMAVTLR